MTLADTNQALEKILHNPGIWRADQGVQGIQPGISTAYPILNEALPEAGWPIGALTELLVSVSGTGELALLTPALRSICAEGRGVALLAPPYVPQARAWEAAGIPLERMLVIDGEGNDLLWAAEQVLRSGECGAVLVWGQAAGRALNHRALQRLHLAASTGSAACFLYRPAAAEAHPSPAQAGNLQVNVVKCRGAVRARPIPLQLFPAHWHKNRIRSLPPQPPAISRASANPTRPEPSKVSATRTTLESIYALSRTPQAGPELSTVGRLSQTAHISPQASPSSLLPHITHAHAPAQVLSSPLPVSPAASGEFGEHAQTSGQPVDESSQVLQAAPETMQAFSSPQPSCLETPQYSATQEAAKESANTLDMPFASPAACPLQQVPSEPYRDLSEAVQALHELSRTLSEALQTPDETLQNPAQLLPTLPKPSQASSASPAGVATQLRLVVPDPAHSA